MLIIRHFRCANGILHRLLLARLFRGRRLLQRNEQNLGYHYHYELLRLREAYLRSWGHGSCCRRHDTRVSDPNGAKTSNLRATENLLTLHLFSWYNVGNRSWQERAFDVDMYYRATIACAIRVAFAVQARGTTDATMAQYHVVTLL